MTSELKHILLCWTAICMIFLIGCDNEPDMEPSSVSFTETNLVVSEDGSAQTITLSLDVPAVMTTTITLDVSSDNATYGEDYTTTPDGSSGSITLDLAEGAQSASFTFTPVDNDDLDEDKLITFTATALGGVSLASAPKFSAFIENDEVSTLSIKEDFDDLKIVSSDLSNSFIMDSWLQLNSNGQVYSSGSDLTLMSFPGNGVGGSLTFDNTADGPGTNFINISKRFLESDVTTSIEDQTFAAGTYYVAFNFTLHELEATTGVRRYASLGQINFNEDNNVLGSAWGPKMCIKGVDDNGTQKFYFGLHKRIGTKGIFQDVVVPADAPARELGTTYLVVIKAVQPDVVDGFEADEEGRDLTADESNSIAYLYVFAEGDDYSAEPATPYAEDAAGADLNLNALVLLASQDRHSASYDGIRVANDWKSLFAE